ncbi:MAG: NAD(P)-dependent oxidoreductase, partial [Bacteroidota bacterium]
MSTFGYEFITKLSSFKQMKKRILITGSSGHCGHQLADSLKADFELVGIDMIEGKYTTHLGNLLDQEFIKRVVQGVDAVLHTASLHAPHVATHSRKDFIETNINGTLNLLEAAQENRIHRFIYTSTTSLYGESMENDNQAVWVTE